MYKTSIRSIQIVGVIDEKGSVLSKLCTFKKSVVHNKKWKNINKKWRWNLYEDVFESLFSDIITEDEIIMIKKHISKKYNIVYNKNILDVKKTKKNLKEFLCDL